MRQKILIVEDERALQDLLRLHLTEAGFETTSVERGEEALLKAYSLQPSLILLDIKLPGIDGFEVCKRLREDSRTRKTPVLILTARGEEIDKVLGFELGATDYVTKPFSPRELVLRVKAILKREETPAAPERFQFGALAVDPEKPLVTYQGIPLPLTPLEIKLLCYLYKHRGRVQTREILLDSVWGYHSAITTRTVDAHVKRLREKLGRGEHLIETIRGFGYRFAEKS